MISDQAYQCVRSVREHPRRVCLRLLMIGIACFLVWAWLLLISTMSVRSYGGTTFSLETAETPEASAEEFEVQIRKDPILLTTMPWPDPLNFVGYRVTISENPPALSAATQQSRREAIRNFADHIQLSRGEIDPDSAEGRLLFAKSRLPGTYTRLSWTALIGFLFLSLWLSCVVVLFAVMGLKYLLQRRCPLALKRLYARDLMCWKCLYPIQTARAARCPECGALVGSV